MPPTPATPPQPLPRMAYRLFEIASMLGVRTKTLRRAVDAGDLAHFRVGTTILVDAEDLDAYIKTRKKGRGA